MVPFGSATVSPSHDSSLPRLSSTDATERRSPRSLSPRYRPRTTKTFGPRYRASSWEPESVSVTATYVPGSGLGVVSAL